MYVVPVVGDVAVGDVTLSDFQRIINTLTYSPSTAKVTYNSVKKLMNYIGSFDTGLAPMLLSNLMLPKLATTNGKSLSDPDLKKFLELIKGRTYESLYLFLVTTGVRNAEARGLLQGELDLVSGEVDINMQVQRVKGKLERVPLKTPESRRRLSIPMIALESLQHHYEQCVAIRRNKSGYFVWANRYNLPITQQSLHADFASVVLQLDDDYRLHDLRHTAASTMVRNKVPMKVVSKVLGHSSVSVTERIYSHLQRDDYEMAASALNNAFNRL